MTTSTTRAATIGPDVWSLRPTGWGRMFDVPFLAVWLAMWAVGEAFGLAMFGATLISLLGSLVGVPVSFAHRMPPADALPFMVLFLLLWLSIWTIGGIAAGTHLLRQIAGRDRLSVSSRGLELEWRAGPFRTRRTLPSSTIRRLRVNPQGSAIVADTAGGTIELTTLGTRDDRAALLSWLKQRIALPDEAHARRLEAEMPPSPWQVEVEGTETRLRQTSRRARAIMATVMWVLTLVMACGWLLPLRAAALAAGPLEAGALEAVAPKAGSPPAVGLIALAFTVPLALAAAWLTWGRSEWIVAVGRLTWRQRFGLWWQRERVFEYAVLEIHHEVDSDGDDSFALRVRTAQAQRKIASVSHDDAVVRALAEWLAARTKFRIERR